MTPKEWLDAQAAELDPEFNVPPLDDEDAQTSFSRPIFELLDEHDEGAFCTHCFADVLDGSATEEQLILMGFRPPAPR